MKKQDLALNFQTKDLRRLNYCLGIEFIQYSNVISISQSKYIADVLRKYEMQDCIPMSTPMEMNTKLMGPTSNEGHMSENLYLDEN